MIHRVHHIVYSFGWVLFPFLPVSLGYFPGFGVRVAKKKFFHDCTKHGSSGKRCRK